MINAKPWISSLFLFFSACTGAPSSSDPSTILIGEYGSLTGSKATFGHSTHNGIQLAIEELNASGGINGRLVEVKTYDDQGKTQEAGTAVTRLITQDKVVALLGEVSSDLSLAGGKIAQKYGIPMISPSSTNVSVTQIGDMIFRVCYIDSFQGFAAASFARNDLKATRIAVLFDQTQSYSIGLKDDFIKSFTAMGGVIAGEPQAYSGAELNLSAQLNAIAATNPEAIFLPGYYSEVASIAMQARQIGISVPFIGGDAWDSEELTAIAGSAIEGSYFTNHYSHEEQRSEVQTFVTSYQTKFGAVPDGLAALGYDAARILFDSMKRSKSLSAKDSDTISLEGKDLARAISETKDFPGVTGLISLDADRNAVKPVVVLQLKNGKPSYVNTIRPISEPPPPPSSDTANPDTAATK